MKAHCDSNPGQRVEQPSAQTSGWIEMPFDEAFEDATSLGTKIPQGSFLQRGRFPIIDQGEAFIAGYSNEESAVWSGKLPVIIFGDHTRALKFVDFRFVLGADGCKVLLPRGMIDPKFAYYHLRHIHLEGAGYSRHFKFLKETSIRFPNIATQRQIAGQLEQADRLRRTRRYALELTDTFLPAAFLELFGSARDSRWDRSTLGELTLDFSYGTSTKCSDNSALQAVLRIPNVIRGAIDTTDLKFGELTPNEQKKLRLEHGDLLFVRTNGNPDYVGRCAVFDLEADLYFASYLIRARTHQKLIAPVFLAAYLRMPDGRRSMQPSIRTTAGQYNVSVEGLRDVQVIVPPLPLQQKFAALVERVERLRSVQREALRQAEHLFASLLHRAFSE
jgi:type I restriction enzyme S subunit